MRIEEFMEKNGFKVERYNHENDGVVYFICDNDGTIIYIGSTMNLYGRIKVHSATIKFFDKPIFFFSAQKEICKKLERKFIYQIKPKYNIQGVANRLHGKKLIKIDWITNKEATKIKKRALSLVKNKKTSYAELAKTMGVTRSRAYQIVNNNDNLHDKTLRMLANALGVVQLPRKKKE